MDPLFLLPMALLIAVAGVRIMFCGHRHDRRRDRRRTDPKVMP